MTICRIWFDGDYLYGEDESGNVLRQSLLWYPRLMHASEGERDNYTISTAGIHWRNLDEDVSFESFYYKDAVPSDFQRFFLEHKEINIAEFSKLVGINASLLRNYIYGYKNPSEERKNKILEKIHSLGEAYVKVAFK